MPILTNVSLQLDGKTQHLENALRQSIGIANLWTITIWIKPKETPSVFDAISGDPLFKPDGKGLIHIKGLTHHNEVLIWGDRVKDSTSEEFITVENWDSGGSRVRISRFNLAQKRQEWRLFSCAWDGSNLLAWDNGAPLTDFNETISGIGSFLMEEPSSYHRQRSVRIGVAYTGVPFTLESPHLVSWSGMLGPVGIWNTVLGDLELGAITSGTFAYDLSSNSGTYTSSASLQHWWRLGADSADIGKDYVSFGEIDLGINATVTGHNIITDSP